MLYPEAEDAVPLVLTEDNSPAILQQLMTIGFTRPQARDAVAYLSQPSPLTSSLLQSAAPLQACVEYLVLHVPECDLPQRFLPSANSSNSFVTSAHGGGDDIKKRWVEERAVKEAGWPVKAVRECLMDSRLVEDWALLTAALNKRLLGDDWTAVFDRDLSSDVTDLITQDDIESIGASYAEDSVTLVMPMFAAPLQLNFVIPPSFPYNISTHPPPMYITSTSMPAYVRLHLLAHLLNAFKNGTILQLGLGLCLGTMQIVEEQWGTIEDQGFPDISLVLQHLIPQPTSLPLDQGVPDTTGPATDRNKRRDGGRQRRDMRDDAKITEEFKAMRNSHKYSELFSLRKKLPAFASKDEFLSMLEKSRVVVVVGETGQWHRAL